MNVRLRFHVSGSDLDDIEVQAERRLRRFCDLENALDIVWQREFEQWYVDFEVDALQAQGGTVISYSASVTASRSR